MWSTVCLSKQIQRLDKCNNVFKKLLKDSESSPEIYSFICNALYSGRSKTKMWLSEKTTCHSWKISSSLSLRFLVSLVIVRGTAPCGACCCCILKDEMSLCDLVSGRKSAVLLVQAASMAATLWRRNRGKDAISLKTNTTDKAKARLHSCLAALSGI